MRYILDELTCCMHWLKLHIQVKCAPLKLIGRFGCAVHWQTSHLQKYISSLTPRAELLQRLAQVRQNTTVEVVWIRCRCA